MRIGEKDMLVALKEILKIAEEKKLQWVHLTPLI